MTHVILKEFYVDKETPYFSDYAKQYTDLPYLVTLTKKNDSYRSNRFLRASDISDQEDKLADWKTVVWDDNRKDFAIPNGSQGFRWDDSNKWNLDLTAEDGSEINPLLSFLNENDDVAMVEFPYFAEKEGGKSERGVPVKRIKDQAGNELIVTTDFGAIAGGGLAGLMVVFGLVVILIRKFSFPRIRVHTTFADYFTIVLLLIIAALGTYMTLIYSTTVVAYEYRLTIGPWFRSLFTFQPLSELMLGIPTLFKVHVIMSFFLFESIPFTQLVHMFSFPARYPTRAPQQYRSRDGYDKS